MFRDLVGQSICGLFTLSFFFFVMSFLIIVIKDTNTNNQVQNNVAIQLSNYPTWGQVPGSLGYQYTREVIFYSVQKLTDTMINLNQGGPFSQTVQRTFADPTWDSTKQVTTYTQDYVYSGLTEQQQAQSYQMVNVAAQSVWYQMINKPRYWLAWQALAQVSNLMWTSNLLNRYYAYNAETYIFNDFNLVSQGVLAGLQPTDQQKVYYDPLFGMDDANKLNFWIACSILGPNSVEYKALQEYFVKQNVPMTDQVMNQITGKNSMINFIIVNLQSVVLSTTVWGQKGSISDFQMSQIQWGQSTFLSNETVTLQGVPGLPSIGVSSFDNVFATYPEYGFYVLNNGGTVDDVISYETTTKLLNPVTDDFITLLNPSNMRDFFQLYDKQMYDSIEQRFNLNYNQSDWMYGYLDKMIELQLKQNGPYENSAMGILVQRALNISSGILSRTFPLEVATRNAALQINSLGTNCTYYMQQDPLMTDQTQINTICANYNFTDVEQLKSWINITWFPSDPVYNQTIISQTGMTQAQIDAFFDLSIPSSFGNFFNGIKKDIATFYSCTNPNQCDDDEIWMMQWAQSKITLNPVYTVTDPYYTPKQNTTVNWGAWPVYGVTDYAPEWYYYQKNATASPLTVDSAALVLSTNVNAYGLLNLYNSMRQMNAYYQNNSTLLHQFETGLETQNTNFPETLIYFVQGFLMQGALADFTAQELMFGFTSPIADNVNGGDFFQGSVFDLSNITTPIINDQIGPISTTKFGIYTGDWTTSEVCQIRIANGAAFVNKIVDMWNGTAYQSQPQQPSGSLSFEDALMFNGAVNGMQFPPKLEQKPVSVYDSHLMQISQYKYIDSATTVGKEKLNLDMYNASFTGGYDAGFAYNMPLVFHSIDCGDCTNSSTQAQSNFSIEVYGLPYKWTTQNSAFTVYMQPESGVLYQNLKEYSMILYMDAPQQAGRLSAMPFPDLQPLVGMNVPFFDMYDDIKANDDVFVSQLSYISLNAQSVKSTMSAFIAMFVVFFVLGVVAWIYWKMGQKNENEDQNREEQEVNLIE